MATVGGNLFAPSPYGDFTTALLALDATVAVQGGYGSRETPLEEFLAGRERGPRGLVASVSLARPGGPEAFRFRKVARVKPKGIAVLTIAAVLPLAGGRIARRAVAYGAMGPTPLRARAVERALEGRTLDAAGIAAAVAAAADGTSTASDAIASDWYRREILPVHLRRLLLDGELRTDEQDRRPVPPQRRRRRGVRRRRREPARPHCATASATPRRNTAAARAPAASARC